VGKKHLHRRPPEFPRTISHDSSLFPKMCKVCAKLTIANPEEFALSLKSSGERGKALFAEWEKMDNSGILPNPQSGSPELPEGGERVPDPVDQTVDSAGSRIGRPFNANSTFPAFSWSFITRILMCSP